MKMTDSVTVQVALRVRPLVESEIQRGCQLSLECIPNEPQVLVKGADKSFTYNYVFGTDTNNEYFYKTAVKDLVSHLFKGYNVTVLAYGQTGSGKTYSMGTSYREGENRGVIPRAIDDIFKYVQNTKEKNFKITVSFMELYREHIFDLLDPNKSSVDIREVAKDVTIPGLTEVVVHSTGETIEHLIRGSSGRATGATAMNAQSSRSHAIFTINVHQQRKSNDICRMTSKFHLVDLAGSERSKKTKSSGERFKEGININRGLLALGNVISALGDECPKGYISYRDSKLTRILQDSLGGNSLTLMIACVSPADYNLDETLSTLRYAHRARQIKNKPVVNQDPTAALIEKLQLEVHQAQAMLKNNKTYGQCPNEHVLLQEKKELLNKSYIELADAFDKECNRKCYLEEYIHSLEVSRDNLKMELENVFSTFTNLMGSLEDAIASNPSFSNPMQHLKCFQSIQTKIKDLLDEQNLSPEDMFSKEVVMGILDEVNVIHSEDNFPQTPLTAITKCDNANKLSLQQRINLGKQLVKHNRVLAAKQKLVDELAINSTEIGNNYIDIEETLKTLELQVQILIKEKEELIHSIQEAKSSVGNTTKEKITHLQRKINILTKKISEQNGILKKKERDGRRFQVLSQEIAAMNANKLCLINKMRNASNQFSFFKLKSETEINKLLERDRKGQTQMKQMKRMHAREKNILKKELDNATEVNRRLKNALAMGKTIQEKHKNMDISAKIEFWLLRELDIEQSIKCAEKTLEELVEEKSKFSTELNDLTNKLKSNTVSDDEKNMLEEKIKCLAGNISERNVQITELQQKGINSEFENQNKTRWDGIQSLPDCKNALKCLLNIALEEKRQVSHLENVLKNLTIDANSKEKSIQTYKLMLKNLKSIHQQQIMILELEYQDKAFSLLKKHCNSCNSFQYDDQLQEFWCKEKKDNKADDVMIHLNVEIENKDIKQEEQLGQLKKEEDSNNDNWKNTPVFNRIRRLKSSSSVESEERKKETKSQKSKYVSFSQISS